MLISREVKISDGDYGNSTHRLEFEIEKGNLVQAHNLLSEWEAALRSGPVNESPDTMTRREAKLVNKRKELLNNILLDLAEFAMK